MLLGCSDLPPQLSTNSNNVFVTMRLVEKSYTNALDINDLTPGRLISLVRSGESGAVVAAVAAQNRLDAVSFFERRRQMQLAIAEATEEEGGLPLRAPLFSSVNTAAGGASGSSAHQQHQQTTAATGFHYRSGGGSGGDDNNNNITNTSNTNNTSVAGGGPLRRKETAAGGAMREVTAASAAAGYYGTNPSSSNNNEAAAVAAAQQHLRISPPPLLSSGSASVDVSAAAPSPISIGPLYRIERVLSVGDAGAASSPIVRNTSDPTWEEIFIFGDLAIPHFYSYATSDNTIEGRMAQAMGFAAVTSTVSGATAEGSAGEGGLTFGAANKDGRSSSDAVSSPFSLVSDGRGAVPGAPPPQIIPASYHAHASSASAKGGGGGGGGTSSVGSSSPNYGGSALPTGRPTVAAAGVGETAASGTSVVPLSVGNLQAPSSYGAEGANVAGNTDAFGLSPSAAAAASSRHRHNSNSNSANNASGTVGGGWSAHAGGYASTALAAAAAAAAERNNSCHSLQTIEGYGVGGGAGVGGGSEGATVVFGGRLRLSPAYDAFGKKLRMPGETARRVVTRRAPLTTNNDSQIDRSAAAANAANADVDADTSEHSSQPTALRFRAARGGGDGDGETEDAARRGGATATTAPHTHAISTASGPTSGAVAAANDEGSPLSLATEGEGGEALNLLTARDPAHDDQPSLSPKGSEHSHAAQQHQHQQQHQPKDMSAAAFKDVLAAHRALSAAGGRSQQQQQGLLTGRSSASDGDDDGGDVADALVTARTHASDASQRGRRKKAVERVVTPAEYEASLLATLEASLLLERQYFLELEVRDVTHTAGIGDLIASASIQVDLFPMTAQKHVACELAVNLRNPTIKLPPLPPSPSGDKKAGGRGGGENPLLSAVRGGTSSPLKAAAAPPPPQIRLVIEPVNFGAVPVPEPPPPMTDFGGVVGTSPRATDIGVAVPPDQRRPISASASSPTRGHGASVASSLSHALAAATATTGAKQPPTAAHVGALRGAQLAGSPLTENLTQHRFAVRRRLQATGAIPLERDADDDAEGFGVIRDPVDLILAKRGLGAGSAARPASSSSSAASAAAAGGRQLFAVSPSYANGATKTSTAALTHTLALLTEAERMELMLQTSTSPNARPIAHLVTEELRDTFCNDFIAEVISILLYIDEETCLEGLGKEEAHTLMQELYAFTGTPLPTDANLAEELRYLFNTFDRDHDEVLTVQEICNILRSSQFRVNVGHRWKVGLAAGPYAPMPSPSSPSAAGGGASAAATLRSSRSNNNNGAHRFSGATANSSNATLHSIPIADHSAYDHTALSPLSGFGQHNGGLTTASGASASLGDPRNVVSAASVAGCLWSEAVPLPFSYAGFRLPSGRPHDGSLPPSLGGPNSPFSALIPYTPAAVRNLFDELYGDAYKPTRTADATTGGKESLAPPELQRNAVTSEDEPYVDHSGLYSALGYGPNGMGAAAVSESEEAAAARRREENRVIPLFERNRPLAAPFRPPQSIVRREAERAQLELLFSSHKARRHPTDKGLPHTAGERLSGVAIESASLSACTVEGSLLIGCRIESGVYTRCTFEGCLILRGATIISPVGGVRSCRIENSKVWSASLFNCKVVRSRVEDCRCVAQTTLQSCALRSVSIFHCFVSDVSLDPTISDGGANIIEGCRIEDIAKMSYAERQLDL